MSAGNASHHTAKALVRGPLQVLRAWAVRAGKPRLRNWCEVRLWALGERTTTLGAAIVRQRLATGDVDAAAAALRAVSPPHLQVRACRVARLDPGNADSKQGFIAHLRNVEVDPGFWMVIDGDQLYSHDINLRNPYNAPIVGERMTPAEDAAVLRYPPPSQVIEQACVLFCGNENYAHWVTRSLPKLLLLQDRSDLLTLPLVVNLGLARFQSEYLQLLGMCGRPLLQLPAQQIVGFRELHVPVQLWGHPRSAEAITWLRDRLAGHRQNPRAASSLLYVSREESGRRKLMNEQEIFAALEPYGFRKIVPGRMRVAEQIFAFSTARVIVAPHGAALTNLAFAPPNCFTLELTSSAIGHMNAFRTLAELLGQTMVTCTSDEYELRDATLRINDPPNLDFRVPVDEVLRLLREHAVLPH